MSWLFDSLFQKEKISYQISSKSDTNTCRDHGVSLNPKRSIFCVIEGKILGHIMSQGVKIDTYRVKSINSYFYK